MSESKSHKKKGTIKKILKDHFHGFWPMQEWTEKQVGRISQRTASTYRIYSTEELRKVFLKIEVN